MLFYGEKHRKPAFLIAYLVVTMIQAVCCLIVSLICFLTLVFVQRETVRGEINYKITQKIISTF